MKNMIKKLVMIAKAKGYRVQFEQYGLDNCAELYRQSKVIPVMNIILLYHNTDFLKLVVLSHEVGHLQTIKKTGLYFENVPYFEYKASQWALRFLKQAGFNRLNEVKALLNKSLKNYEARLL